MNFKLRLYDAGCTTAGAEPRRLAPRALEEADKMRRPGTDSTIPHRIKYKKFSR